MRLTAGVDQHHTPLRGWGREEITVPSNESLEEVRPMLTKGCICLPETGAPASKNGRP